MIRHKKKEPNSLSFVPQNTKQTYNFNKISSVSQALDNFQTSHHIPLEVFKGNLSHIALCRTKLSPFANGWIMLASQAENWRCSVKTCQEVWIFFFCSKRSYLNINVFILFVFILLLYSTVWSGLPFLCNMDYKTNQSTCQTIWSI